MTSDAILSYDERLRRAQEKAAALLFTLLRRVQDWETANCLPSEERLLTEMEDLVRQAVALGARAAAGEDVSHDQCH